ncbi:hypothetical protein, conserved [Eimeria maxima]|uniref:LRRK2 ANK repeat domain-containing protein n=1 Tax=Eimeria maxima TaxID=5804 RepID=U6MBH2_EIMMA|nr:hypothetical protein, conserved [Eimeria maxima]CDJ60408.1 hypothetical protein, conserved [Eimeria maxima]
MCERAVPQVTQNYGEFAIVIAAQVDDTSQTAHYWDLVHARGRVAYFISTRYLQKVLKPILKLGPTDAAAQILLEDAHAAALTIPEACSEPQQQQHQKQLQRRWRVAQPLAPLSHTLLELMCGSRPTHVRLLQSEAVATYVGIDASQRALSLAREACRRQIFTVELFRSGTMHAAGGAAEGVIGAAEAGPRTTTATCVHELLGRCMLLRNDCRMLSEELPLLQSRFVLLVAGLDDIIARSTTDNTDARGPCDEALLQVLHSAAFALPVGGTLLLVEPTKHFPELLLSLYKALQHPVLSCRLLMCEAAELVGPARDVLLLRLRRHTDASECMRALEHFHATDVARLAARKAFRRGLQGALEAPQAVQQAMPLCHRLSLVQQAEEMAFLLCQACNEGNIFATTKLLALGAEVNYSTTNNSTTAYPLCAAVAAGDPHLVDLLIRHGAKPTGSPYDDPLSVAAELLLRDAVAAGLCLPDEFKCTGCNSVEEKHIAAYSSGGPTRLLTNLALW